MSRWMARLAAAVWVGTMLAGLIGCGGDARNDPYIAQKFSEIDNQLAKMKDVPSRMQDFNEDFTQIRDELAKLKGATGGPGVPPQRLTDLEKRLDALEAAMNAMRTSGKGGAAAPKSTPAPPAPTPAPAAPKATPAAPPAATPAPAAPAPKPTPMTLQTKPGAPPTSPTATAAKASSGKGKAAKTKKAPVEPSTVGGAYYIAAEGETLANIAQKFGISVADLCGANTFLRPDTAVYPGLKVWIPKK